MHAQQAYSHTHPQLQHAREQGSMQARSWGQDRMDQLHLPLDGAYSPGDLDGRGVHGECAVAWGVW